jgi:hypothetical protein
MKKKRTIAITALAILVLLAVALFRGQMSRELILKRNGLPLANLRADVLPRAHPVTTMVRTSTDLNGRLDLSALPDGTDTIAITLWDGGVSVFNGDIVLPTSGSRTIDFRGSRTICTTERTYADFALFKLTGQEVEDRNMTVAPPKAEAKQPLPVDRARLWAEAEKGRRDRKLPLTPDFADWLLQTPHAERYGLVFPLKANPASQMSDKRASRRISAIGKRAAVIVNKEAGKYASAHDLRRSFGTRWAKRVMPAVLQKLMRHSAIESTLRYYADIDADELAEGLWTKWAPVATQLETTPRTHPESGGTLGGTRLLTTHPTKMAQTANPFTPTS